MSELMKQIKDDLKAAMTSEIYIRKNPATGVFIKSQQSVMDCCVAQKNVSRAIISMCPEIGKKPSTVTDDDVLKLLKRFISQHKERELYIQKHLTESDVDGANPQQLKKLVSEKFQELGDKLSSPEIEIAKMYLPIQASEEEIKKWIDANLDLSTFKNKMQAMGPIMKQFKGCDGNIIKSILMKM